MRVTKEGACARRSPKWETWVVQSKEIAREFPKQNPRFTPERVSSTLSDGRTVVATGQAGHLSESACAAPRSLLAQLRLPTMQPGALSCPARKTLSSVGAQPVVGALTDSPVAGPGGPRRGSALAAQWSLWAQLPPPTTQPGATSDAPCASSTVRPRATSLTQDSVHSSFLVTVPGTRLYMVLHAPLAMCQVY